MKPPLSLSELTEGFARGVEIKWIPHRNQLLCRDASRPVGLGGECAFWSPDKEPPPDWVPAALCEAWVDGGPAAALKVLNKDIPGLISPSAPPPQDDLLLEAARRRGEQIHQEIQDQLDLNRRPGNGVHKETQGRPDWVSPAQVIEDVLRIGREGAVRPRYPGSAEPAFDEASTKDNLKSTNPKTAIGDTKVPLALCSPIASAHWALAQYCGMRKYQAWNWRIAGVLVSTYISAIKRHLDAYESGEELDPVDGTHHLGNIMACAAILLDAQAAGKLDDDRPPIVGCRETYAFVEKQMALIRERYKHIEQRPYTIKDSADDADDLADRSWRDYLREGP